MAARGFKVFVIVFKIYQLKEGRSILKNPWRPESFKYPKVSKKNLKCEIIFFLNSERVKRSTFFVFSSSLGGGSMSALLKS